MPEKVKYTALLLDADETIFDFLESERLSFAEVCESFGISCTPGLAQRYHDVNLSRWKAFERGEIEKSEILTSRFAITFSEMGIAVDPAEANSRYVARLSEKAILLPGALGAVKALAERFRLIIITNGVLKTQLSRMSRSEIRPYVGAMYVSDDVGYQKPDRRYFEAVLAAEHLRADECLVVGDSLTSDILGAANAGIDSVWVDASASGRETTAKFAIKALAELPGLL